MAKPHTRSRSLGASDGVTKKKKTRNHVSDVEYFGDPKEILRAQVPICTFC